MNTQTTALPRHRWKKRIVALSMSTILTLIGCELALRAVTNRFSPPPYPLTCDSPELYKDWPSSGYRALPSRTIEFTYPNPEPRPITIVTNSDGFRDRRELDEEDSRPRILMVGDSFVFGSGVEQDERFSNLVEALEPNWRVANIGMAGYGMDLMLMALEDVGPKFNPDLVLVCIYTDDIRRVRSHYAGKGFEIPRYAEENGDLSIVEYPKRRIWDSFHLVQAWRVCYWSKTSAEWELNEAIIERIDEWCETSDAKLGFVFLPARHDSENDQVRRNRIQESAKRMEAGFLDLTEPIQSFGEAAFIPGDDHYDASGHAIVAESMVPFIDRMIR